jgi:hypothetical protein
MRVEEYYSKRTAGQNMYSAEVFYGEAADSNEMDAVWDELKTLRVRLNQVSKGGQVVQPTYMAAAPAQPQVVNNTPADPTGMLNNFATAMMSFLNSQGDQGQFLQTRGGKDSAPQSGPGF